MFEKLPEATKNNLVDKARDYCFKAMEVAYASGLGSVEFQYEKNEPLECEIWSKVIQLLNDDRIISKRVYAASAVITLNLAASTSVSLPSAKTVCEVAKFKETYDDYVAKSKEAYDDCVKSALLDTRLQILLIKALNGILCKKKMPIALCEDFYEEIDTAFPESEWPVSRLMTALAEKYPGAGFRTQKERYGASRFCWLELYCDFSAMQT
jgi:hypothetical protein